MSEILTGMDLIRANPGMMSEIARQLEITRAAVNKWKRVPAERVLEIERTMLVSRHVLRPDIYPPPLRNVEGRLATPPPNRKHKKPSNATNAAA